MLVNYRLGLCVCVKLETRNYGNSTPDRGWSKAIGHVRVSNFHNSHLGDASQAYT